MRVDRVDNGFRIDAPGYGIFAIAPSGDSIRCALEPVPQWRWQRPLFGQAIPLAATLRGLELLHASAVALGDRVAAFVGVSGAGKTSLATHLTARGGQLLTDDVLALECKTDHVAAYPGVRMANIAQEQLDALTPAARARVGRRIAASEKVHVEVASMPSGPLPLTALYFVERGVDVDDVAVESVDPPDPRELLGATFMPHVVTPARLLAQLHTCSEIAGRTSMWRLLAPWQASATEIADAVERHIGAAL
jgi:ABC-type dipeptide/oligopeptide/nickel transport system ATPase component